MPVRVREGQRKRERIFSSTDPGVGLDPMTVIMT